MPDVSVLIPIFGRHPGVRSLPEVCRAWAEQDLSCEVIVAVGGETELTLSETDGVRIVRECAEAMAPGLLRNVAARHSSAAFLYLSDADVVPLGRDFLGRAVELASGGALAQPWMYRLVDGVVPAGSTLRQPAEAERFCFAEVAADGELTAIAGERFVHDGTDLMVVPQQHLITGADTELVWRPPFHWGGALVDRRLFMEIGGYCESYKGWGCEDDDLLVKVAALRKLTYAWQIAPDLACAHFEHPRPYDTEEFAANQALLQRRTLAGATSMIEEDLSLLVNPGEE